MRIGAKITREIIDETSIVLWEVLFPIYLMTKPTPEKLRNIISKQFEELWNYPNVCGSVDRKSYPYSTTISQKIGLLQL